MNELEELLRHGLANVPEPHLQPVAGLGRALWKRRARRRAAVAGGAVALVVASVPVALASRSEHRPHHVSVATEPSPTPTASTSPTTRPQAVVIAGLTFEVPGELAILRPTKIHDNARPGGPSAVATDAAFGIPNERSLDITVYDGELAGQWSVVAPGSSRLTTLSGHPTKISSFPGSAPAGQTATSYCQVLVRVSPTRTMLLLSTGLGEDATLAVAASAFAD